MKACFLHTLSSIYCLDFFDDGHSDWYEMMTHSFDLHFSNNEQYWAPFHVFIGHLYVLFEKVCLGLLTTFLFCCLFF